jgi:hypothetical protein
VLNESLKLEAVLAPVYQPHIYQYVLASLILTPTCRLLAGKLLAVFAAITLVLSVKRSAVLLPLQALNHHNTYQYILLSDKPVTYCLFACRFDTVETAVTPLENVILSVIAESSVASSVHQLQYPYSAVTHNQLSITPKASLYLVRFTITLY